MDPPPAAADQLSAFIQQHLNFDYGHVHTPLAQERASEDAGPSAEDSESCSSQDTMILIGGSSDAPPQGAEAAASPSYVLAKAPGMRSPRREQPQQPFNMHIDYFSGIHTCDEDEQEAVLEEANEGSPEPLAYENQYLQVGRKPRTVAVRRDEDKDDGYDSPGGQSSETSSTESTANQQKKPLKSILPKPSERAKRKKEVKRVRFETVEEQEEEEEGAEEPPPVPPPPKEKRPFPFQTGPKIPSFRKMNSMLREQREASPVSEPSAPQISSLEERLRQLTTADDDDARLSPGSVSSDRQVLYSQQTHVTVPNPRDVLFDQETGERQLLHGEHSEPQGEQQLQQVHLVEAREHHGPQDHERTDTRGRYIDRHFTESVLHSLNQMKLNGMSNRALLHSVTLREPRDELDRSSSSSIPQMAAPEQAHNVSECSRPRYASTADIYNMLDRQRQNPFRPESRTQPSRVTYDPRATYDLRVSPPRDMNADMQELWQSVHCGDAKSTVL